MEPEIQDVGVKRFGAYLRRIREQKKLSLDSVEEMSAGFSERITKSHLSRIENGLAVPTIPRLLALGQIYGVPISSLAERFEIEAVHATGVVPIEGRSSEELLGEAVKLRRAGRFVDALAIYTALVEREHAEPSVDAARLVDLQIGRVNTLVHSERHETAKIECEEMLGREGLLPRQKVSILQFFAMACYRLGRFEVAMMGLDQAERHLGELGSEGDKLRADLHVLRGNIHHLLRAHAEARTHFERAIEIYEVLSEGYERSFARLNLVAALIALGDLARARTLCESILDEATARGYEKHQSLAWSHLAVIHYKNSDSRSAEACCIRSNVIARPREYSSVVFRNCFYLWKISLDRRDEQGARLNERTLKAYLSRLDEPLPEADEFRARFGGGAA